MGLVDFQSLYRPSRMPMFESVLLILWWIPETTVIYRRYVKILCDSSNPSRNPVNGFTSWNCH